MDCYETLRELSSLIGRETAPGLKGEVEVHLGYCRSCHAVYNIARNTIQLHCCDRAEIAEHVRKRLLEVVQAVLAEDQSTIVVERNCQPPFGVARHFSKRRLRAAKRFALSWINSEKGVKPMTEVSHTLPAPGIRC